MKKPPVTRSSKLMARISPRESWHKGADQEIHTYARSLQRAAQTLIEKLDRNAIVDWDVCPVVLLYRDCLELHLKALVGEGCGFLKSPTDPISLSQTHSLRWLAQIVCQIIKAVRWEKDFTCEGVVSLADFSALVNDVESFDPVTRAIRSSRGPSPSSVSDFYRSFDIVAFSKRLDALLHLLDVTADALAATWDQQEQGEATFYAGDKVKPTIH